MNDRRALTLLEVLFAAAILAVLAATCAPFLRSARAAIESASDPALSAHAALHHFADSFLENSAAFGVDDMFALDSMTVQIDEIEQLQITIERLQSSEQNAAAMWLCFKFGDSFELRRVEIDSTAEHDRE